MVMKKLWKISVFGLALMAISWNSYAQQWEYEIQEGDSLWTIAKQYMVHGSYVRRLQQYNNISNPLVLRPGQILKAPLEWLGNLPGTAEVLSISGVAEVVNKTKRTKVTKGYMFKADDQLITGEDGVLKILFSDKSVLNVYANTSLLFSVMKQSYDGSIINVKVVIEKGQINILANPKKAQGTRMEIQSPSALTAVRGTRFRVRVDSDSAETATEVLSGKVDVIAQQKKVEVKKLYGTKAIDGKSPINPVKLLQGPKIKPHAIIETKFSSIDWQPIEGAESYRVRVASKEDFSDMFYDKVVLGTQASRVFFPKDGAFFTSVRAVDNEGIEGIDTIAKLQVNARPEPPLIIAPKNDTVTFDTLPVFSWAVPGSSVETLHYQLSNYEDFSSLLIDKTFAASDTLKLETPLEEGKYYWRVANLDASGQGPYSVPLAFTVKAQPKIVPQIIKSEAGTQINLSLSKDASVSKYHVQVARNPKFTNIVFDEWVEGEEFAFNTKGVGNYYIRLGVEDQETGTINYADSQKVVVPFSEWKKVFISLAMGLLVIL